MTTFTHRNGDTVSFDGPLSQLAKEFSGIAREDHFAWFWMAKAVAESSRDMSGIRSINLMFLLAIANGMKRPRVTVRHNGYRWQLYLSNRGTLCVKRAAYVDGDRVGESAYVGCIFDGRFLHAQDKGYGVAGNKPDTEEFIETLGSGGAAFLARAGKDMGTCCYCNKPLTDEFSKQAGYGKTCAKNWNLPYGKNYTERTPLLAAIAASPAMSACIDDIASNPYDPTFWSVLSDQLEDLGWDRLSPPDKSTPIPAL